MKKSIIKSAQWWLSVSELNKGITCPGTGNPDWVCTD